MRFTFLPVGLAALLLAAGCNRDRQDAEVEVVETVESDQAAVPAPTDADSASETDAAGDEAPGGLVMPENGPPIEPPAAEEASPAAEDQSTATPAPERPALVVGSMAPPLDIEHWVQKGQEDFQPVSEFEEGKVYVVEFWATWCGPCISSMPHLAETQQKYADQGVRIVSVSNEPLETVEGFLKRPAPTEEEPERTFGQLTSAYSLTTDPDESVYEDYMRAANQNGIPTAFIVGKAGHVEWIGHPMNMDEPLAAVVDGSWDRQAYAEQYAAEQRVQETVQRAFSLGRQGNTDGALAMLNEALQENDLPQVQRQLKQYKLQLLIAMGNRQEEAAQLVSEMLDEAADDTAAISSVTWLIYQVADQGGVSDELVNKAITAAENALKDLEKDERAYLLDTVAHLQEHAGNLDAAIAAQQEAVDVAESRFAQQLQKYLDELKETKAAQEGEAKAEEAPEQEPPAADAEAEADAGDAEAVQEVEPEAEDE